MPQFPSAAPDGAVIELVALSCSLLLNWKYSGTPAGGMKVAAKAGSVAVTIKPPVKAADIARARIFIKPSSQPLPAQAPTPQYR